ncbi:MAG: hypothetical protein RR472_00250, partial [Anaerovoracaceae bacterium]
MSVIFVVAMVFGLLVIAKPYAVYATGEKVSDPWVVKSNGKEVAVVESKEAGESVVTGVKATYIKGVIEQQEADVLEDITVEKYRFDDASTHPVVMTTPEAVEHIVGLNEKSDAPLQIATSEVVTEQVAIPYTEETMDSDNYFVG